MNCPTVACFKMDQTLRYRFNTLVLIILAQLTVSMITNGATTTNFTIISTTTNNNNTSSYSQLSSAPTSLSSQQSATTIVHNQYSNATRSTLLELRALFTNKSVKFDESFRQLLSSSKRDFNHMFVSTYGLHYEKNSQIFTDMYEDLERYYNNGDINLDKSMDHFFQLLYRKLFQVFNSQYEFNDSYLNCISQQLEKLNPFGDYAVNFISNIKRTFIATRTFLKALNVGIEIITNMIELGQSTQCQSLIQSKLQSAPMPPISQQQQQGGIGIAIPVNRPPCLKFCEQVLEKTCFKFNQDLDREWNNYVDSLVKLANRLRTSLNIESVVDPIDVRISEAIMNFQDNGDKIKQQVFQACGMPHTSHYLGLTYPTQTGGVSSMAQSAPKSPLLRIAPNSLSRRYKRDYVNPAIPQTRTRTNNRNRAQSILPVTLSGITSPISSSTTRPFMSSNPPFMIPSPNNHFSSPMISGTIIPKSSQQSSMLLQSSSLASSTTATGTTTVTTTNNDEQKILTLIVEIRQQMNKTIGFWYRLPNNVCLNKQILGGYSNKQISAQPNCYSSQLSELDNSQIGSLSRYLKTNMMAANEAKHSSTVQQQVNTLRLTINRMNMALEGKDVDWYETSTSVVSTSLPTTTTTPPPRPPSPSPPQSTTTATSIMNEDKSGEDENSLPWCPKSITSVNDGVDIGSVEVSDDQPTTEDQNSNGEHENGEEFGSGDGGIGDGESDDDSSSEDDSTEEDEEESDSDAPSSEQEDSDNDSNENESGSTEVNTKSSEQEQPSNNPRRGWYRGKPCRIAETDSQTTPLPTAPITIQPDIDITKELPDGTDFTPPPNNVDSPIVLEIGPSLLNNANPSGSAAQVCNSITVMLSLYLPLLVTLSLIWDNRLII